MGEKATGKKKVLLIDDHPLLRKGLRALIDQEKDLVVCGEAEDAATALRVVEQLQPDVAVMDITLPDANGIDLLKDLRIRQPKLRVLVLSMHEESFYAERVLRAGARGYVTKGEPSTRVIEGIHALLNDQLFVSSAVSAKMLSRLVGERSPNTQAGVEVLSDREFEVLEMIGNGQQSREIAEKLHLSVKTIDAHRENIKRKLKLADASELLKYAIQWVQAQRQS
jgi:DNA-binding NarL/FixJ family response regulator